jgi:hypothetical protein
MLYDQVGSYTQAFPYELTLSLGATPASIDSILFHTIHRPCVHSFHQVKSGCHPWLVGSFPGTRLSLLLLYFTKPPINHALSRLIFLLRLKFAFTVSLTFYHPIDLSYTPTLARLSSIDRTRVPRFPIGYSYSRSQCREGWFLPSVGDPAVSVRPFLDITSNFLLRYTGTLVLSPGFRKSTCTLMYSQYRPPSESINSS